jgi:thioester reductase-like protein
MGYGESKLVSELLIDKIAKSIGSCVNFNILRVGQIAGSINATGSWNQNEWFPSLLRTSKEMQMMPGILGSMDAIDWIPADRLAEIVLEIVHSSSTIGRETGAKVFNLVNPSVVQFSSFVSFIHERLGPTTKIVSWDEWVNALEVLGGEDEVMLDEYPALKILEFFRRSRVDPGKKATKFETANSEMASLTMKELNPINEDMLGHWMDSWGL